ncbi:class I SAM-dependent methyltransferase [Kibdelosporangium phytohabitans]|uniref:Methylase n=1 Tax=Kibdelosporangium phytohabitans TaxID=860235 RepID=A0A0N9HXE0_9PSEU|nr:class I SAM-dependent methyltransferase [Kibdelosporangium phytohabitans]ALG06889.1 methylase [Kibdelosporangium phytohabitans]MBE1468142.1 SAM-dependent methyltransferase [Kibdelosporangium phytohabitans]
MGAHTHDDFDWTARLADLRHHDAIAADANRGTAERLVAMLQPGATVIDIGSGAGGMAAHLGLALRARGGGRLVLVDAVSELLEAANDHVRAALSGPGATVTVDTVLGDAASDRLGDQVPPADLVWASAVVHHLRDQQEGVNRLASLLTPGGWLALAEGGLGTQCLPWDLGAGEPGLPDRLTAAAKSWFAQMRADIPGSVRLTVGWTRSLRDAGLTDVTSFSYLIDHPAPVSEEVRTAAVKWLEYLTELSVDRLAEDDRAALTALLDPAGPAYIGARDDLFYLASATVNLGKRR